MAEHLPRIFSGIPAAQIAAALKVFQKIKADYGTMLMEEGDVDPTLIVVLDGEVEICTGDVTLGTAGAGKLVGEMALFGGGIRTACVEAIAPSTFLVLDKDGYESLRDSGNMVAQAIEEVVLEQMVERLRFTGDRISRLASGTPVEHLQPSKTFFQRVAEAFGAGGARSVKVDAPVVLAKATIFGGAAPETLEALGKYFEGWSYGPGHFLCTEGQYGHEMYVLAEGLVDVVIETSEDFVEPVAVLEPGDAFGLVSLVEDRPRMASCVARDKVTVLELHRENWDKLSKASGPVGSLLRTAMIRALIDQVAYANAQIALLDHERDRRTMEDLEPLVRASAGVEAHGSHLDDTEAFFLEAIED